MRPGTEPVMPITGDSGAAFLDRFKAMLQYPLPQHAVSRAVHWLTRVQRPGFKNWLIRRFVRRFRVDLQEAAQPDPTAYATFNAFFTRALRESARPVAMRDDDVICPVDGSVSQIGDIHDGRIVQAKGRTFSVLELLGGDAALTQLFEAGKFATLYLSPKDYHRVHMPLTGTLTGMRHIPGRLFSVNPPTTRAVPNLFARNERVATVFETAAGPMGLAMVGALCVASIETVWAGEITPPHRRMVREWKYHDASVQLGKGAEMGRFNMGSTVILLFARERIRWERSLVTGSSVRMGQLMATAIRN